MPDGDRKRYDAVTVMRKLQLAMCAAALLCSACHKAGPLSQAPDRPSPSFEMRSFETMRPGCGDHGNHAQACVSFRAVWPEMRGGRNGAAATMNLVVMAALGFPAGPESMAPYGEQLIERWRVEHRGAVYADSSWFERRAVQVLARRPGVWCFQVDRLGQTGDALPFDERTYLSLNPQTGAPVALNSLLAARAESRFASAVEARLRSALNLPPGAPLPLKDSQFALPAQFAFSPAGVILAWRGAELRQPTEAPIEIVLPWSEARELVSQKAVRPPSPEVTQGF
jgi:hypothetical protein